MILHNPAIRDSNAPALQHSSTPKGVLYKVHVATSSLRKFTKVILREPNHERATL